MDFCTSRDLQAAFEWEYIIYTLRTDEVKISTLSLIYFVVLGSQYVRMSSKDF